MCNGKKVVVLKIDDYQRDVLREKIEEALFSHFDFKSLFSPQDKILLKPNLLMEASQEQAIVTHPIFLEAIGMIFKERGFKVFVADSPGGFVSEKDINSIYKSTGIEKVAREKGFELLYPDKVVVKKNFPLCWWVDNFKMINLPKLKTHDIMVLTLAVKNLYGCISGLYKSYLHKVYPRTQEFSKVLLKLYKLIKPSLNIVDGILALEGEGPSKKGTPKKLGIVIIGDDALCVDYVVGKLFNLEDDFHPIIKEAKREGIFDEGGVEIISPIREKLEFKFPSSSFLNRFPPFFLSFLRSILKFRPEIDKNRCKKCGVCIKVCPHQAIKLKGSKMTIDYKKCILCMCCHEMCKFAAVDLKKSIFLRVMEKFH